MAVDDLLLRCCLCGRPIPVARYDAYVLDDEWVRRRPGMRGRIACGGCVLADVWVCDPDDTEHIPSVIEGRRDIDSWSHITRQGTLKAMAVQFPEYAVEQGGCAYLERVLAEPKRLPQEFLDRIRHALQSDDAA